MQKKNTTGIRKVLEMLLFLVMLVVLWQILYFVAVDILKFWKPYSVPSPKGVADSFVSLLQSGVLFSAIGKSLGRGIAGFAMAVVIGGIVGVLIHHFPYLNRNLKPVILGMQTLPSICCNGFGF